MQTYKVVRQWFEGGTRVIKRGLTLEEAQEWCRDPETSSSTAKNPNLSRGPWFDGYEEE